MKRSLAQVALLAVLFGSASWTPVAAQQRTLVGVGPAGGYAVDLGEVFLGGLVRFAPPVNLSENVPLAFEGGFEYYFNIDPGSFFNINVAAIAQFDVPNSPVKPSAGAGLAFSRASVDAPLIGNVSSTNTNLQLQGGIQINLVSVDGLLRVGDGSDFIVRVAVLFGSLTR